MEEKEKIIQMGKFVTNGEMFFTVLTNRGRIFELIDDEWTEMPLPDFIYS